MAHNRQRGLLHHGAKTTERKGGFVGQPPKEETKQKREEDGHVLHVGTQVHLVSRSAVLVCKSREGRFWKLVPSLFVYKDLL